MTILIHDTAEELADTAATLILGSLGSWRRPATFGIAGGGTPRPTYQRLAAAAFDWSGITVWLPDERWVPADHPDSNARMARETFVDATRARLLIPDYRLGDPAAAASSYEADLDGLFAESGDSRPDLVLLGMGDDGHTASLFPGSAALDEQDRSYVATWVAAKDSWRLSATYPLLAAARQIVFLVSGRDKASMLARILDDDADFPAGRVARSAENVTWLLDAPAASMLRARPR